MLRHMDEMQEANRPAIRELIERLSADARGWAEAEMALAQSELGELKGRAIRVLVSAVIGFAAVFSVLVVLSQAGIAFLAPHVGGAGTAALIIGGLLLVVVAACGLTIRSAMSWHTDSVIFRWFGNRPPDGPPP